MCFTIKRNFVVLLSKKNCEFIKYFVQLFDFIFKF